MFLFFVGFSNSFPNFWLARNALLIYNRCISNTIYITLFIKYSTGAPRHHFSKDQGLRCKKATRRTKTQKLARVRKESIDPSISPAPAPPAPQIKAPRDEAPIQQLHASLHSTHHKTASASGGARVSTEARRTEEEGYHRHPEFKQSNL